MVASPAMSMSAVSAVSAASATLPRALSFAVALLLGAALGCDSSSSSSQPPKGKPLPAGQGSGSSKPVGGEAGGEAGGGAPTATRTPMVAAEHPLYARMEGEGLNNNCTADTECFRGGCGAEICSADASANSTCDVIDASIPASAGCGCVSGHCIWYTTDGATLPMGQAGDSGDEPPKDKDKDKDKEPASVTCGEKTCAAGETCIEYYGIAGPNGPRFQSCGIPCGPKRRCPEGKSCVTIADGPGDVCQ